MSDNWNDLTKEQLVAMVECMSEHAPRADETCEEPGITYGEATRRKLIDDRHPAFADTLIAGGEGERG